MGRTLAEETKSTAAVARVGTRVGETSVAVERTRVAVGATAVAVGVGCVAVGITVRVGSCVLVAGGIEAIG